ncbi:unnamed protein product [Symbiodinium microadriaticum]|nr:unnamed protein product [Symbiodinium microadriaticum]
MERQSLEHGEKRRSSTAVWLRAVPDTFTTTLVVYAGQRRLVLPGGEDLLSFELIKALCEDPTTGRVMDNIVETLVDRSPHEHRVDRGQKTVRIRDPRRTPRIRTRSMTMDYGDESVHMQTNIREALTKPSPEDLLLNRLHKAFLQLEALLVAINIETPPLPQGDLLIIEYQWTCIWWSRLIGQPQNDISDTEIELGNIEEQMAARERELRAAEEADQDARENMYMLRLQELADQHAETSKPRRPQKRLCLGTCITDGSTTKAHDYELKEGTTVQLHIKAEPKTFPGRWHKDGKEVPESAVPDILKDDQGTLPAKDEKTLPKKPTRPTKVECNTSPHLKYDLEKPATRELYDRWMRVEVSSQTVVQIASTDMLAFFLAMSEITEHEMQDLNSRGTRPPAPPRG